MIEEQDNKSRKQLTNKWSHLKQQLRQRQLLFYKAEIPLHLIDEYLRKTPSKEEILRIEEVILNDRREKTAKIRSGLQKHVGHLKSPQVSRNIGVSDTAIREIWTEKKTAASYEIIDKLELYLNFNYGFELSLENPLTVRQFLDDEVDKIISDINSISSSLTYIAASIKGIVAKGEYESEYFSLTEKRNLPTPIDKLNKLRGKLDDITIELQSRLDSFIKK